MLNLNSLSFRLGWKRLKDSMIKFVTFYLPVQPAGPSLIEVRLMKHSASQKASLTHYSTFA